MSHSIALNFEDGVTRIVECKPGETVLDAAYRNKVNLPMDCSDGVCGTCKCRCEAGDYDLGDDYLEDALSPLEAADRLVLTCQMTPSSDCVIAVPVPSSACKVAPATHGAEVIALELASDTTIVLRVKLDRPEQLSFLPGQYVNVHVPGADQHRAYSFSSKPGSTEASFLIRNLPGGLMSTWLAKEARPGARLTFTGPYGSFFLRPLGRPSLMLAGGTGLAPLLSMLEVLADHGAEHPIHLIYGVTNDSDLVEMERIEALSRRLPTLALTTCVADPASDHERKGFVTAHVTDEQLNGGDCDIYLCGPPAMVDAVQQFLAAKHLQPAHFYYEKFAPSEAA